MTYTSTQLAADNSIEEINKVAMDLLAKINAVSGSMSSIGQEIHATFGTARVTPYLTAPTPVVVGVISLGIGKYYLGYNAQISYTNAIATNNTSVQCALSLSSGIATDPLLSSVLLISNPLFTNTSEILGPASQSRIITTLSASTYYFLLWSQNNGGTISCDFANVSAIRLG